MMKFTTRVTERLNITYPIIQGGLAYLAYSDSLLQCQMREDWARLQPCH